MYCAHLCILEVVIFIGYVLGNQYIFPWFCQIKTTWEKRNPQKEEARVMVHQMETLSRMTRLMLEGRSPGKWRMRWQSSIPKRRMNITERTLMVRNLDIALLFFVFFFTVSYVYLRMQFVKNWRYHCDHVFIYLLQYIYDFFFFFFFHVDLQKKLHDAVMRCTACNEQINHQIRSLVYTHPVLGVLSCKVICQSRLHSIW